MDNVLMVAIDTSEQRIGFLGMLKLLVLRPRTFFAKTVACDRFPYLLFSAWLVGLAHAFQWLDGSLLKEGGMVSNQLSSFILIIVMSAVFMGFFYLLGGGLFHFYAYLADARKDMKNSLAVATYAWMPFVIAVFLTKLVSIILLGNDYTNPPQGWWFQMPSMAIIGISIIYGWFLAIYGSVKALKSKTFRSIITLFVIPILWFLVLFVLFQNLGMM